MSDKHKQYIETLQTHLRFEKGWMDWYAEQVQIGQAEGVIRIGDYRNLLRYQERHNNKSKKLKEVVKKYGQDKA